MNRCPKIEYGRLSGEIGWAGVNSRILSSQKADACARVFSIADWRRRKEIGSSDTFRPTWCSPSQCRSSSVAASLSRVYVTNGRIVLLIVALILFTIGNTLMVRVMREMGLGVAVSIATIAQFVLINLIAYRRLPGAAVTHAARRHRARRVGMVLILLPRSSG